MSYPQFPDKSARPALFGAADLLAARRATGDAPDLGRPPPAVILCYQPALLRYAARRFRGRQVRGFFGQCLLLRRTQGRVAVLGDFGLGAPAAVVQLEILAALGVRRCLSLGLAGGLQADLKTGDVVLVDEAIRDEGTSYHYLPPAPTVARPDGPDAGLIDRWQAALDSQGIPVRRGVTWTTDAPFRESVAEVEHYRARGVAAVEMEAAALYAAGQRRQVAVVCGLVISDRLEPGGWRPAQDHEASRARLAQALGAAVDAALAAVDGGELG